MSEEALLRQLTGAGAAQSAALRELYRTKGREFGRYFVSHGVSPASAEDIVQEVVFRILKTANSFRGDGTANAWMWQIARNCLIDFQRGSHERHEKLLDDEQWQEQERESPYLRDSGETDVSRQIEECVDRGLSRFARDDPERAYVLEMVVEGMDQKEIADRLGRTYGAVRTFICECRKKLAPYIRDCLELLPNQGRAH